MRQQQGELQGLHELKKLIENHLYISPELRTIDTYLLPINTCYYSIGLIILKIVFNSFLLINLNKIKYTKLYFCLMRCLQNNPKHRFFVLV